MQVIEAFFDVLELMFACDIYLIISFSHQSLLEDKYTLSWYYLKWK